MKTDVLIDMLARGAGPAPQAVAARRLWPAAALGLLASAALAVALFGSVPAAMYSTPMPWIKLAYAAALALAAGWLTAGLSRPVARLSAPRLALLAVAAAMALLGLGAVLSAGPGRQSGQLLGRTWLTCPSSILALSIPALVAALWAIRGLAPTRPRAAGFAAGLLAGAVGAFGYALACPEMSAAFVAVWYSLGIVLTGVLGAILGPWVLRW